MSLGFGLSALGFAPFGLGDVDTAPAPATDNLIDAKGVQQSARAIDAATGQYVLNADGRMQGMPRVEQLVLLRVRAMTLPAGDVTPNLTAKIAIMMQTGLADLVQQGFIAILGVVPFAEQPTRIRAALKYRDLTTGKEVLVPL